jgi:hypothetical protein
MGVSFRPSALADDIEITPTPASELHALAMQPTVAETLREEQSGSWTVGKTWHLIGVILLAVGLAGIAYAGVRIVMDQRMAALYHEPVPMGGWRILAAGLLALVSGAAVLVMIERRG